DELREEVREYEGAFLVSVGPEDSERDHLRRRVLILLGPGRRGPAHGRARRGRARGLEAREVEGNVRLLALHLPVPVGKARPEVAALGFLERARIHLDLGKL